MEENVNHNNKKKSTSNLENTHFIGAVNQLLDHITDKDETVRYAIEMSLFRMAENHPNDALLTLCNFKIKHPKINESQTALILRVIARVSVQQSNKLNDETLKNCIDMAIVEITKHQDNSSMIQKPGLEIIVSIGRLYCDKSMDALCAQMVHGQPIHFAILQCMGSLALVNIIGIIPFVKRVLTSILPTMGSVKLDHVKQAYAFAIGRFAEAITEYSTQIIVKINDETTNLDTNQQNQNDESYKSEMTIAYDILFHHWLPNREPKVCADILQALAEIFPLLSIETIVDQVPKIITKLLSFYRRSIDRNAITQLLVSVLKTTIQTDPKLIEPLSDTLVVSLFDLVCVNPDYEKPQTVKGHFEVLRCFDLLLEVYSTKIFEMLLIQMRSNNERERIKSLMVLTHLTNTFDNTIQLRINDFTVELKELIKLEKTFKAKLVLLKTIVALAQKQLINDTIFIKFILRHSCTLAKQNNEYGTVDEQADLNDACKNSLYILATTVTTMDNLLKTVLIQSYMSLDYTSITGTIAKCLSILFARNSSTQQILNDEIGLPLITNTIVTTTSSNDITETTILPVTTPTTPTATSPPPPPSPIPSADSVFIRSLILLAPGPSEILRSENILLFLKYYCPILNKHLRPLWLERIPELILSLQKTETSNEFNEKIYSFLIETIKNIDDYKFAESLVIKFASQISLYPQLPLPNNQINEFLLTNQQKERGMLIKLLAISLCSISDREQINNMIDLIITIAKQERLEKGTPISELEQLMENPAKSLAFISRTHLKIVLEKINTLVEEEGSRKSNNFFQNLLKDSNKEADMYRINLLTILSYKQIVLMAPINQVLIDIDKTMVKYLCKQLSEVKDFTIRKLSLITLLTIGQQLYKYANNTNNTNNIDETMLQQMKFTILSILIKFDGSLDNLPLFPIILQLATILIKPTVGVNVMLIDEQYRIEVYHFFEEYCQKFFNNAEQLKKKFDSTEDDERNSYLAKYINLSLPELNSLVRSIFELSPSPATLDDVNNVLEIWVKNPNSEVRICACHVLNNVLEVFKKTVKIGCEAPAKFNQAGSMLAAAVPRCIDLNATVRQTAVEILKKILEISCLYDLFTIPDNTTDWIKDLNRIREDIITSDRKEMYRLTEDIAKVIALRLSNFQYLQFCKALLDTLNDVETSSAIGSSIVLKFFIQTKGSELFHAIPQFIGDALHALSICTCDKAASGVLKALVALTKHHPKLVCNEMLSQKLPYNKHVKEYWQTLANYDQELYGIVLDNFLIILSSSCLYEPSDTNDHQNVASIRPFAIHCALHEMLPCQLKSELKKRFPELFSMLLTSLATYTNLSPPSPSTIASAAASNQQHNNTTTSSSSLSTSTSSTTTTPPKTNMKFFSLTKDALKMNPCLIVLETFQSFLTSLEMEQIVAVLTVCPQLSSSSELTNFMEILTPMAVGLVNQLGIGSIQFNETVKILSKYVSSPYDSQRIAAVGLFSQLIPLKPTGDIASVILLHLNSALNDPNPLVRGFCIRGFAFIGELNDHDIDKYTEISLSALLKGVDDFNSDCLIDIPLESMLGLSKILNTLPRARLENFHVSLAIRIKPFFENSSDSIREAAILLLGDLCQSKTGVASIENFQHETNDIDDLSNEKQIHYSEALREQLYSNLFPMLLHLSETNLQIVRACKETLRKICALLPAPKVNSMVQGHLLDYGQLQYDNFVTALVKLIGEEIADNIVDFIDSCLPYIKSNWPEIRGNSAVIIGLLHNLNRTNQAATENVGKNISILLSDQQIGVRVKAAQSLGLMFGESVS